MSVISKGVEYLEGYDNRKKLKSEQYDENVRRIVKYVSNTSIFIIILDVTISLAFFSFFYIYLKL